jgi:hypothetical protein
VSTQPFGSEYEVLVDAAAAARLADYDLRDDYFLGAQVQGYGRRQRFQVPAYPRTFAGQYMWAETVASLRSQLLDSDHGWQIGSRMNYETVYRTDKKIAIAVVGGDRYTGVAGPVWPRTARARGRITIQRILSNQLALFDVPGPTPAAAARDDSSCQDWMFLINARDDTLYSELSLADVMTDPRSPHWLTRIILPSIPMEGAITPIEGDGVDGDDDDVDVDPR